MCEEKNVGGDKMEKPADFVIETVKSIGLEPKIVKVRMDPYSDEEETDLLDVLDTIWKIGQYTGGFTLVTEKRVPEFVVIEEGYRPNEFSRYFYSKTGMLATDGQTIFVSRLVDSDGNTHHDIYYKYKLLNATFAIVTRYEKNNFHGTEQEFLDVWVYGREDKLVTVLRRLNDLLSP